MIITQETEKDQKLFFLNIGGYDPREFGELHKNILLIAPDAKATTKNALQRSKVWTLPHKDNVFEVEKAIDVTDLTSPYGYRLQLVRETTERPFQFQCAYIRIGL